MSSNIKAEVLTQDKVVIESTIQVLFGVSTFVASLTAAFMVFHEPRLWTEPQGIAALGITIYSMASLNWLHFLRTDKTLALLMAGVPVAASMMGLMIGLQ